MLAAILEPVLAGGAIALLALGAFAALSAANLVKRLVGLVIAGLGAVAALAALGASGGIVAVVAVTFAYLVIGAAIVIRLQEAYGTIEAAEIDAADAQAEREERT